MRYLKFKVRKTQERTRQIVTSGQIQKLVGKTLKHPTTTGYYLDPSSYFKTNEIGAVTRRAYM